MSHQHSIYYLLVFSALLNTVVLMDNQNIDNSWPITQFTLINQRNIQFSSKYQFSIHPPETQPQIISASMHTTYSQIYKQYVVQYNLHGNAGILRMYLKNGQLVIYEGTKVRIMPAVNRLSFLHLKKQIIEFQILYTLIYGSNAEYEKIGLSYFIMPCIQQQCSQAGKDFLNDLSNAFKTNKYSKGAQIFHIQKYFPLPQTDQLETLYAYRLNQVDSKFMWTVGSKSLEIPVQDFEYLQKSMNIDEISSTQTVKDAYRNIYALKIKPFKAKIRQQKNQKNIEQQIQQDKQCSSSKQQQMPQQL